MQHKKIFACFLVVLIVSTFVTARPQEVDLVERDADGQEPNQGWVRRQLMKAGEAASRIGSGVGGYAVKLTNAVDRICKVIKKIIPIVGAVCTVGKFQFCSLESAADGMGDTVGGLAIEGRSVEPAAPVGPQTDFDEVDKRK